MSLSFSFLGFCLGEVWLKMSDEKVDVDSLWDEETKLGENLILDESQGILAATSSLNQLIIFMTDVKEEEEQQQQLWDDVILTHPTFTTSKKLFRKMIERYNIPKQLMNKEGEGGDLKWYSKVQSRVVRFLLCWMESEPRDFVDEETIKELSELTKTFQSGGWDVFAEEIISILQKKIEPLLLPTTLDVSETLLPPGTNVDKLLLDLDETTFAQQVTLNDARVYQRTQKREFLSLAWNREAYFHRCPNVRRFITDFNILSSWVPTVIVSEQNIERRVEIYCKIVRTAFVCFRLHNFHGAMKLLSGFQNSAVYRLKLTKEAAPNEIRGMLKEMMEVFSHRSSYSTYRNLVSTIKPPAIPYLGVSLSDLVFLEDGGVDSNYINLRKYKMMCEVIKNFRRFQGVAFPFEEDPIIMRCFGNLNIIDEDKLYQLSKQIEPRRLI